MIGYCDAWGAGSWWIASTVMLVMGYVVGRAHAADLQKSKKD
jgi:hypothetical protein